MPVSVSAAMIVRDEEEGIAKAITSVRALDTIDEVVILDTGSTDRTLEIARSLGAQLHEDPWTGDFAHHRNRCLDLCTNDWVLSIDGDEELDAVGNLDRFFDDPSADGVAVHIHSTSATGLSETAAAVRAFDRRKARWRCPVHEELVGLERIFLSTARIVTGPDENLVETIKERREILLAHAAEHPDDPHDAYHIAKTTWSGRLRFVAS